MKKKLFALLLTLAMVLSLFPSAAIASGAETDPLSAMVDGTCVQVAGLQGELPEGVSLSVEKLEGEKAALYLQDMAKWGVEVKDNALVLDVKLLDEKGMPYQPEDYGQLVQLSFLNAAFGESTKVWHYMSEPAASAEEAPAPEIKSPLRSRSFGPAFSEVGAGFGGGVSCTTGSFSVYVVGEQIPRLMVQFMNGEEELASMKVKLDDDLSVVIPEPIIEPAPGVVFKGWTTDPEYTVATEPKLIDAVRTEVSGMLPPTVDADDPDAKPVVYYAMLFRQYIMNYLDENGASLGQVIIEFRADDDELQKEFKIENSYTPKDDTHGFLGWTVLEGAENINGYVADTLYKVNDVINVTGSVTFAVYAPEGHWLVFDENGKGGTYNAPQFVQSGSVTVEPTMEMVRKGYKFGGWYDSKENADAHGADTSVTTGQFTFGSELSEKKTIYASWIPETQVGYSVIVWKQNLDGGYDFAETISLNGAIGATVNTVSQQGTGNNAYARINGTNYQYSGFHLDHFDQNVVIDAAGGSVVNVYYDRTEYTLTFQVQQGNGWNQQWTTIKTITALFEAPIGDNFPIVGTNGVTYNEGQRWRPQNSSTFDDVIVFLDIMPAENVTFHVDTIDRPTRTMYYYVEALEGDTVDKTYNGMNYTLYNTIRANLGYIDRDLDWLDLNGFNKQASDPAFPSNGRLYENEVSFYYTRKVYPINHLDGAYVDGNGNPLTEADQGQLYVENNIPYGADLSAHIADQPPADKIPAGYVFEGWYLDKECTSVCDFDGMTMPEGGITVYAKWRQIEYRVFLHPNAGSGTAEDPNDQTLDWGSEGQAMNFRIPWGGTISLPTGLRTGYEFIGWYLDENFTQMFTESMILNDTTVKTAYDWDVVFTDDMNQWGNGATYNKDKNNNRFWITRKLDLYAKWSATLEGADGIHLQYSVTDPDSGTSPSEAPKDSRLYVDSAVAYAPVAVDGPEGYHFENWVMQKWDDAAGTDGDFVDVTGSVIYAGAEFKVLKENARVEGTGKYVQNSAGEFLDSNGLVIDQSVAGWESKLVEIKTYTVQLRAEFKENEHTTPTFIPWFKNDGTKAFHTDKGTEEAPLQINEGVAIQAPPTREGSYKFIGWAFVDMGSDPDAFVADAANLTQMNLTPDLYYNEADQKFYTDAGFTSTNVATKVAADENTPYQGIFAVWVAEVEAIVAGGEDSKPYTGSQQTYEDYTVTYKVGGVVVNELPNGVTASFDVTPAAGTNVGDYTGSVTVTLTSTVSDYAVKDQPETETTSEIKLTITPAPVTIKVDGSSSQMSFTGSEQTYTGTVTPTSQTDGFTVDESKFSYSGNTEAKGTDVGDYTTLLTEDGCSYNDTNYTITWQIGDPITLTITPADVKIKVSGDSSTLPYNGSEQTYTGKVTAESQTEGFTVDASKFSYNGSKDAKGTNVGDYTTELTKADCSYSDTSYNVTWVIGDPITLTITPAEVTLVANSDEKDYTGSEQEVSGYTCKVNGEEVTGLTFVDVRASGSGTNVGEYDVTFKDNLTVGKTTDSTGNYVVAAVEEGTLTIKAVALTVTAADQTYTFNGSAQGEDNKQYSSADIEGKASAATLLGNDTLSEITLNGTQTNAGEYPKEIKASGAKITNADGEEVTNNYTITYVAGKLTITPAEITITVTGSSDSLTYTGSEQTYEGTVTATSEDQSFNESLFTYDGSKTVSGTNVGEYTTDLVEASCSYDGGNYNVTWKIGDPIKLTIDPAEAEITADDKTKTYGDEDPEFTFTVEGLQGSDTEDLFKDAVTLSREAGENVGSYAITPAAKEGQDATTAAVTIGNYVVSFEPGTLTIDPAQITITITGNTDTVTYDGTEHKVEGYEAESESELFDAAKITTKAEAVAVGTDAGEYEMGLPEQQFNYEDRNVEATFEITDGKLTIEAQKPEDNQVTVTYNAGDHGTLAGLDSETIQAEENGHGGYVDPIASFTTKGSEVTADEDWVLVNWTNDFDSQTSADGVFTFENVPVGTEKITITANYKIDAIGGGDNGKDPDGIPDEYQVIVYYETDGNGTVTGKTFETFTAEQENGQYPAAIAVKSTGSEAEPNEGYALKNWTNDQNSETSTDGVFDFGEVKLGSTITVTANFAEDKNGGGDNGKDPDGIPDEYQVIVYYETDGNGTVTGKTYETFTAEEENGQYPAAIAVKSTGSEAEPNEGYALKNWTNDQNSETSADGAFDFGEVKLGSTITVTANFAEDKNGGGDNGKDPDGIPDDIQVIVYYETDGNGTVTGKTFETFTAEEENGQYPAAIAVKSTGSEAEPNEGYALDNWTNDQNDETSADGVFDFGEVELGTEITITANFDTDEIGEDEDGDGEPDPDGIPDKYQILITYEADANGKITGKTFEVITAEQDANGRYPETIKASSTGSEAEPNEGYALDNWTNDQNDETSTDGAFDFGEVELGTEITVTANFDTDEIGEDEDGDGEPDPDGIPDKYQILITYEADANGKITGKTFEVISAEQDANGRYPETIKASSTGSEAEPNEGYALDNWTNDQNSDTSADGAFDFGEVELGTEITVTANFDIDAIGGGDEGDEPDGIPDKYQILIKYVADAHGTITGAKAEVINPQPDGSGVYPYTVDVSAKGSEAKPDDGFLLKDWTNDFDDQTSTDGAFEFKAVPLGTTITVTASFLSESGDPRTITYKDGVNGTVFQDVVYTAYDGDPTPRFGQEGPGRVNFLFIGWNDGKKTYAPDEELPLVNGDATYTAMWRAALEPIYPPAPVEPSPVLNYDDHVAYIKGFEDGTFRPNDNLTRAQSATMIYRLLTEERQKQIYTTWNNFSDVDASKWYNEYVSSMANGDYVKGYPDGTFGGDKLITRAEFVTMLVRFFGVLDADCRFTDVARDHWAYQYIATATAYGWLTGYEDNTFRPNQPITRAEAVTVINRMLNRGVDATSNIGLFNVKTFTDVQDARKWYFYEVIEAANDHEYTGHRPNEQWSKVW